MANTTQKSVILIVVFLICCATIILMAVSLGTENWVTETRYFQPPNTTLATGTSTESTQNTVTTTLAHTTTTTVADTTTTTVADTTGTTLADTTGTTVADTTTTTVADTTGTTLADTTGTTLADTTGTTVADTTGTTLADTTTTTLAGPIPEFMSKSRARRGAEVADDDGTTATGQSTTPSTTPSSFSYTLNINLGLFTGYANKVYITPKTCNFGVANNLVINMGLWVVSVIFLLLAIVLAVVGAIFAAINATLTPIEEITGLTGLYVWNGLAAFTTLAGMLCYVGLQSSSLQDINFAADYDCLGNAAIMASLIPGKSSLGYSFYILIGVLVMFIVNLGLIYLTTRSLRLSRSAPPDDFGYDEKNQGAIMLF